MKKIVILALVLSTLTISAQKRKDKEGSIKNLKGISAYNLVFD